MERYFKPWADECGIDFDELMALGHFPDDRTDAPFNMAVMGLRLAGMSNGVAKLHGDVSRRMFPSLWPDMPADEAPIGSVTNGVHARTWTSPEMDDLLSRHVLPAWHEAEAEDWARIDDVRDDELWRVREQGRDRLVGFVRERLRGVASVARHERVATRRGPTRPSTPASSPSASPAGSPPTSGPPCCCRSPTG